MFYGVSSRQRRGTSHGAKLTDWYGWVESCLGTGWKVEEGIINANPEQISYEKTPDGGENVVVSCVKMDFL